MKTNQPSANNDEQLRSVLREWTVDAPLPPRFQERVWQRIAQAEHRLEPAFWAGISQWLAEVLPRPKMVLSYMAALLVLGMAAGSVAAQVKSGQMQSALSERYVESIDPYHSEPTGP